VDCYEEYCRQVLLEVEAEVRGNDPVLSKVGYVRFLSRSKGRGRKRRCPLTVELIKYLSTCHTPKRARLDEIAQALGVAGDDELMEYLRKEK
jgi:hypothetical protein